MSEPEHAHLPSEAVDWKALAIAAVLALCFCLALAFVTLLRDGVEGHYLVVAPPWATSAETINLVTKADGALVSQGGLDNILIAASEAPEFADALRQAGAWAVFAAPRFLGCGAPAGEVNS